MSPAGSINPGRSTLGCMLVAPLICNPLLIQAIANLSRSFMQRQKDLNGHRSRGPERARQSVPACKRLSSGQPGHRQSEVRKDETFYLIRLTPQNITPVQHRSCCSMDNRAARRRDLIGSSGQSLPCSDSLESVVSFVAFTPPYLPDK